MLKKSFLALSLAAATVAIPSLAQAEVRFSFGAGPSWTKGTVDVGDLGDINTSQNGINLMYKVDSKNSRVGLVGTFNYSDGSDRIRLDGNQLDVYYPGGLEGVKEKDSFHAYGSVKGEFKHISLTVGPSYRFNRYLTAYAQVGVAHTKADFSASAGVSYRDNEELYYERSVSMKASDSDTDIVYGLGLTVQPSRHWFGNIYYQEGEGLFKSETFTVGIGYMF